MVTINETTMYRKTLLIFGFGVVIMCCLLWGAEFAFPNSIASMLVLIAVVVLGFTFVRPGWNLRPNRLQPSWFVILCLILVSAVAAAWVLVFFAIPIPYDFSTLDIKSAVLSILLITGIEELLFRQILYQWLQQRRIAPRTTVVATALAFGFAHLGPVFIGSHIGALFYLLQSVYMVWIGILLGECRFRTNTWLVPWFAHAGYNIAVLYTLSILIL